MVQGIIDVCLGVLEWLISLFPNITVYDGFNQAITSIYGVLYETSVIVPFSDLFICIGLISGFYVVLFSIKCINWIVHRIPVLN